MTGCSDFTKSERKSDAGFAISTPDYLLKPILARLGTFIFQKDIDDAYYDHILVGIRLPTS